LFYPKENPGKLLVLAPILEDSQLIKPEIRLIETYLIFLHVVENLELVLAELSVLHVVKVSVLLIERG
jgi:hypothetical protein